MMVSGFTSMVINALGAHPECGAAIIYALILTNVLCIIWTVNASDPARIASSPTGKNAGATLASWAGIGMTAPTRVKTR